jgi:iron(III) transport system ATP-binding protein
VNGQPVYSSSTGIFVAPNRRGFGMVFQSYAIWPHMNVFQNVAFPLEVGSRRFSRQEIRDKVARVLTAVRLDHLAEREATKLSGGQQQRLALARALVMEPALLLLDEPLSNLDAKLRDQMRFELKRLQRELKITTVYVTHDQTEALALSHQIAVMKDGRIQQIGTPREIYERPASQFVADFVGNTNFLDGTVLDGRGAGPHSRPPRGAPRAPPHMPTFSRSAPRSATSRCAPRRSSGPTSASRCRCVPRTWS